MSSMKTEAQAVMPVNGCHALEGLCCGWRKGAKTDLRGPNPLLYTLVNIEHALALQHEVAVLAATSASEVEGLPLVDPGAKLGPLLLRLK